MDTCRPKSRFRSLRDEEIEAIRAKQEKEFDDMHQVFADEQKVGPIVAVICGIALGALLIWLELVMLCTITGND